MIRKPLQTPPPADKTLGNELLQYYQAIERASEEMLRAAREGDWDTVVNLEGACAVLIAQLKKISEDDCLDSTEKQEKTRILQQILVNDAKIRNLAEPCPSDLGKLLLGDPAQRLH